jgi:hypothetical protein
MACAALGTASLWIAPLREVRAFSAAQRPRMPSSEGELQIGAEPLPAEDDPYEVRGNRRPDSLEVTPAFRAYQRAVQPAPG